MTYKLRILNIIDDNVRWYYFKRIIILLVIDVHKESRFYMSNINISI